MSSITFYIRYSTNYLMKDIIKEFEILIPRRWMTPKLIEMLDLYHKDD